MGFLRRLLGLETKPGEPESIGDDRFDEEIAQSDLPCIVEIYNLWCSSCQVMTGLLNEIGPDYIGKARFFKVNAERSPSIPQKFGVSGVPTILMLDRGEVIDRLTGLVPLNELRAWIERHTEPDGTDAPPLDH
jgi:thioredoxin-like negative regulator of GroEL